MAIVKKPQLIEYVDIYFEQKDWGFGCGHRDLLAWKEGKYVRLLSPSTLRTVRVKETIFTSLKPRELELNVRIMHKRLLACRRKYVRLTILFKINVIKTALKLLKEEEGNNNGSISGEETRKA